MLSVQSSFVLLIVFGCHCTPNADTCAISITGAGSKHGGATFSRQMAIDPDPPQAVCNAQNESKVVISDV